MLPVKTKNKNTTASKLGKRRKSIAVRLNDLHFSSPSFAVFIFAIVYHK